MRDDEQVNLDARSALLLYIKGLAMGLGDSVPGISGGTIAVITGIYDRLIYSIRSVDAQACRSLFSGRIREAWQHINGSFLLLVAIGMLSGLLLSATTVLYLLEYHREALMAFFIGLVIASVCLLRSEFELGRLAHGFALLAGAMLTVGVGLMESLQVSLSLPYLFVCGAIAISAMILPGLSGAFILILLGAYQFMLEALVTFDLPSIFVFVAGCACGLLAFSRLIAWALHRYHSISYATISGMLLGSLFILWPWQLQDSLNGVTNEVVNGAEEAANSLRIAPVWPLNYSELTGNEPNILLAFLMLVLGAGLVFAVHRAFNNAHEEFNSE